MLNLYQIYNEPEKLDYYFDYGESIKHLISRNYDQNLYPIIHIIKRDPRWSFMYARDTIKGRWIVGEEAIAKSSYYSFFYAKEIVNGRWPEGERAIMANNTHWHWYIEYVLKRIRSNAEPVMPCSC